MIRVFAAVIFLVLACPAYGQVETFHTGKHITIQFVEPSVTTNGEPITNLEYTVISIKDKNTDELLHVHSFLAVGPEGGKTLGYDYTVDVADGAMRELEIKVYAQNTDGLIGEFSKAYVVVDTGAPGVVTDLVVVSNTGTGSPVDPLEPTFPGEVARLLTNSQYDALTKVTPSGSYTVWEPEGVFSDGTGGANFTWADQARPYVVLPFSPVIDATTATMLSYRFTVKNAVPIIANPGEYYYLNRINPNGFPGDSRVMFRLTSNGELALAHRVYADGSSAAKEASIIPAGPIEAIEVRLYRSTDNATADGKQELWVDGSLVSTITDFILANDFHYEQMYVGPWFESGSSGTIFIGNVIVTHENGVPFE